VILYWNDREVIGDCLHPINSVTETAEFEFAAPVNGPTETGVQGNTGIAPDSGIKITFDLE
jgi:hypothetical protein